MNEANIAIIIFLKWSFMCLLTYSYRHICADIAVGVLSANAAENRSEEDGQRSEMLPVIRQQSYSRPVTASSRRRSEKYRCRQ